MRFSSVAHFSFVPLLAHVYLVNSNMEYANVCDSLDLR